MRRLLATVRAALGWLGHLKPLLVRSYHLLLDFNILLVFVVFFMASAAITFGVVLGTGALQAYVRLFELWEVSTWFEVIVMAVVVVTPPTLAVMAFALALALVLALPVLGPLVRVSQIAVDFRVARGLLTAGESTPTSGDDVLPSPGQDGP